MRSTTHSDTSRTYSPSSSRLCRARRSSTSFSPASSMSPHRDVPDQQHHHLAQATPWTAPARPAAPARDRRRTPAAGSRGRVLPCSGNAGTPAPRTRPRLERSALRRRPGEAVPREQRLGRLDDSDPAFLGRQAQTCPCTYDTSCSLARLSERLLGSHRRVRGSRFQIAAIAMSNAWPISGASHGWSRTRGRSWN